MRSRTALAGVILLIVGIYWKLALLGAQYVWFDHYDLCQLEIPRLQFVARNLHLGHFPLWDPHIWAGLPVIGAAQPGPVYPLNLLFLLMPLAHGAIGVVTLNWWFIAMHLVAGCCAWALCRELGVSPAGSALGAVAYSCSGYVGSIPWFEMANAASLAPAVFLFALRLWSGVKRRQSAALLGLVLGLSWLSGHHETPLIMSYAVLFGSLALAMAQTVRRRRADLSLLMYTGVAFALAAAVGAVQILPLYEFGRLAKRWVGTPQPIGFGERVPYYIHQQYSLTWKGVLGLLVPTPTVEAHTTIFAGVTVIALAAIGLAAGWHKRAFRYVAWIGVGGLVYSLGGNTPLHRLAWEVLPMLEKARTPVRGMFLVGLVLAVLAARGADEVLARRHLVAIAVVGALFILLGATGWLPAMYPAVATHYFVKGLVALAVVALFCLRPLPGRRVVLIALVAVEASTLAAFRVVRLTPATVCAASMLDRQDIVRQIKAEIGQGRIALDRDELMTNPGDLWGIDQLQSFVAGVPANLLDLDLSKPETRRLLGVTVEWSHGKLTHDPDAFPRAWVMNSTDPVTVSRPDTDTVVMEATLSRPGEVVLSDVYYPGWSAEVDGRPAPIREAYGALRGVPVPAGAHTIRMHYRPLLVTLGTVLTLVALLACLGLATIRSGAGNRPGR
jgi:hypothetical protein